VPEEEKIYSWWSYRARDWQASDRGRRLDHIWISQGLRGQVTDHAIIKPARGWPRASDHVPVLATLALEGDRARISMQVPKSRCAIAVSRARIVSLPVREICFNAEEGCVLMPDGSIVTVDVKDNPYSERLHSQDSPLEKSGEHGRQSAGSALLRLPQLSPQEQMLLIRPVRPDPRC